MKGRARLKALLEGMGSVLVICPVREEVHASCLYQEPASIMEAIGSDWASVGEYLRTAMHSTSSERTENTNKSPYHEGHQGHL